MELKTVKDAFDRVAKKQKLSNSKTLEVVDMMSQEIDKALNTIQEAPPAGSDIPLYHKSVVADLKKTFEEIDPSKQLEAPQKELNVALTKYPKVLEKTLNPDLSMAYRNFEFDPHTVHQIIADFLYRQGMVNIGESFISETGESESSARNSFIEMNLILEALERRDLGPALNWAALNSDKLKEANSDLEMKLHSLQFLEIAKDGNSNEALDYARKHIATYSDTYFPKIQKLMGSLLWKQNLAKSPYADFLSPGLWTKAAKELTRQYCNILGEPSECPLSVTIEAGSLALPPLFKFLNVLVKNRKDWQTMEHLPVHVPLPEEFQYHTVFVCPVSRELSSEANPAMRLCCGHVLCKLSINRMSKNGTKTFKCPNCPTDIDASQCKQLYF
ncbi:RMD5-like protein [Cardamine amara subsp. amara]|uniref:RMD5-like protein n=1 Tax=Cardamine amara subsp. amara TaxID=228776 RepID=A0ABD1B391_CARAN